MITRSPVWSVLRVRDGDHGTSDSSVTVFADRQEDDEPMRSNRHLMSPQMIAALQAIAQLSAPDGDEIADAHGLLAHAS